MTYQQYRLLKTINKNPHIKIEESYDFDFLLANHLIRFTDIKIDDEGVEHISEDSPIILTKNGYYELKRWEQSAFRHYLPIWISVFALIISIISIVISIVC